MKRGLDTSALVYAHISSLPGHDRVRDYLARELRGARTLVVTPMVLHEFVHVVTDGRRFDPPVAMSEALSVARLYLERSNVECVPVDEAAVRRAFDLIERHRLGRNRIADTLLAATLLENDVRDIVTCNARDFEQFAGLRVIDPLTARPPRA